MAETPALVRSIGRVDLLAISINTVIGAGIFALPGNVAQLLGAASPVAYVVAGIAILAIAVCFAEASSQFEGSGGPYLYTRRAFGGFAGFEIAWIFLVARVTAVAALSNTFSEYLGYLWPALAQGAGRLAAVTLMIGILTGVNYFGVRPSVWMVNALTIGKLIPLVLFCGVGMFFLDSHRFSFATIPDSRPLVQASVLLIFALGGFENASIPSEEALHPRRDTPVALIASVVLVAVLYVVIQVVALSTLPSLATSPTPLASAGGMFLGPAGGFLLTLGAVISTAGSNSTNLLVAPRLLYALAQSGQMPRALARLHPRYRTPALSIGLYGVVAWVLAVSSGFAKLAAFSAIARLMMYLVVCAAIPVLRRKIPAEERGFTLPGGAAIPMLAVGLCVWLLTGTTIEQAALAGVALTVGALVHWRARPGKKTGESAPHAGPA